MRVRMPAMTVAGKLTACFRIRAREIMASINKDGNPGNASSFSQSERGRNSGAIIVYSNSSAQVTMCFSGVSSSRSLRRFWRRSLLRYGWPSGRMEVDVGNVPDASWYAEPNLQGEARGETFVGDLCSMFCRIVFTSCVTSTGDRAGSATTAMPSL